MNWLSVDHAANGSGRHVLISGNHPVCAECERFRATHQHTVNAISGKCYVCGIQWWAAGDDLKWVADGARPEQFGLPLGQAQEVNQGDA